MLGLIHAKNGCTKPLYEAGGPRGDVTVRVHPLRLDIGDFENEGLS